jgi:hypothetical protein
VSERESDWASIEPYSLEEAKEFIERVPWTFAKTAAFMPHYYVIRGWREVQDPEFLRLWALIREHGYRAKWTAPSGPEVDYGAAGKTFTNTYLDIEEWTYWVIPPAMLNREHQDVQTPPFNNGRRVRLVEMSEPAAGSRLNCRDPWTTTSTTSSRTSPSRPPTGRRSETDT